MPNHFQNVLLCSGTYEFDAKKFDQLIQQGVRKYVVEQVQQHGEAGMMPAASPTEVGPQFPGGGFDSGLT